MCLASTKHCGSVFWLQALWRKSLTMAEGKNTEKTASGCCIILRLNPFPQDIKGEDAVGGVMSQTNKTWWQVQGTRDIRSAQQTYCSFSFPVTAVEIGKTKPGRPNLQSSVEQLGREYTHWVKTSSMPDTTGVFWEMELMNGQRIDSLS